MSPPPPPSAALVSLLAVVASVHVSTSNIVAIAALLFTVASFWLLNAHRGRLRSIGPRAYAFVGDDALRRHRFPLVLFNGGAVARLVADIRLVIEGEPRKPTLLWVTTRNQLRRASDDSHAFATPFAIHGRARGS